MKDRVDRRVLGAIRWLDAVTKAVIAQPLAVRAATASLTRNLSGLFVITTANGLEKYTGHLDLATLPPADVKPDESVTVTGQVEDPTGCYLARIFTVALPRNGTTTLPHPANSLFSPVDLELLPTPRAKAMAGWAQVRVTVKKQSGEPFANVLIRVVATANNRVLGRGMSDARGEALVAVPGLPLFQAGATPDKVVTSETAAKIEFIPPTSAAPLVDWTALDALAAIPANIRATPLALKAGETYSLQSSVTS